MDDDWKNQLPSHKEKRKAGGQQRRLVGGELESYRKEMETPYQALMHDVHKTFLEGKSCSRSKAPEFFDSEERIPDLPAPLHTTFPQKAVKGASDSAQKVPRHNNPFTLNPKKSTTTENIGDPVPNGSAEHDSNGNNKPQSGDSLSGFALTAPKGNNPTLSIGAVEIDIASKKKIQPYEYCLDANMSRGGRGGGRGGMLKGATWEHDASIKLESKPSDLFPAYKIPVAAPLTEKEKREITYYQNLRDEIHRGPLYTKARKVDPDMPAKTYGEEQYNSRYGIKSKADIDPFVGVPTYSMKYDQKKHTIPQLSARPFNKELFPKELWSTIEGEEGEEVRAHINRAIKKKALFMSVVNSNDPTEKAQLLLDKMKNATEDEDGEGEMDEEEQVEEDYDYEEDEDEMGGDYDGEQYFENGEQDEEDGGDGGGDDY